MMIENAMVLPDTWEAPRPMMRCPNCGTEWEKRGAWWSDGATEVWRVPVFGGICRACAQRYAEECQDIVADFIAKRDLGPDVVMLYAGPGNHIGRSRAAQWARFMKERMPSLYRQACVEYIHDRGLGQELANEVWGEV